MQHSSLTYCNQATSATRQEANLKPEVRETGSIASCILKIIAQTSEAQIKRKKKPTKKRKKGKTTKKDRRKKKRNIATTRSKRTSKVRKETLRSSFMPLPLNFSEKSPGNEVSSNSGLKLLVLNFICAWQQHFYE